MAPRVMIYTPGTQEYNRGSRMTEVIQFYRFSGSRWTLRCATVAWLLLLGGASPVRPQEQVSPYDVAVGHPVAREIGGGEEHPYQVRLSAGQHARVVVDQKGIDVVLALLG